jgi:hypothetical protein
MFIIAWRVILFQNITITSCGRSGIIMAELIVARLFCFCGQICRLQTTKRNFVSCKSPVWIGHFTYCTIAATAAIIPTCRKNFSLQPLHAMTLRAMTLHEFVRPLYE